MVDRVGTQLRKGVVEQCILGLLEREPMYGYQLSHELEAAGLIASIGTLYPVLGRLRERNLVVVFEQDAGSGPVRKYYRLSAAGHDELAAFRAAWAPFRRAVDSMVNGDER